MRSVTVEDGPGAVVIVDGPSLHAMATRLDRRVDYGNLLATLRDMTSDPEALGLYFASVVPGEKTLAPLFALLVRTGFHLLTQTAHRFSRPRGSPVVRGGVDVLLTIKAISAVEAGRREVVLVSGTGLLAELVRELKGRGAHVTVVSTTSVEGTLKSAFASRALVEAADKFVEATEIDALWARPIEREKERCGSSPPT